MKCINTVRGFLVLTAVLYLTGTPVADAQQTAAETDPDTVYHLDEIIISASKYPETPQSVGRNVTVITREEIDKSIHTSVADLLAEQQSLHMVGAGQTPGSLQQGFLRNSNTNHVAVLIDGVRISDPSSTDNGIDFSELSLAGVERIEIVRGSHSTLYGSSAIGGVINIITRKGYDGGLSTDISTEHGNLGSGAYSTRNRGWFGYTAGNGLYANFGIHQQFTNGLDATVDTVTAQGFNPQDRDGFRKLDITGKAGFQRQNLDIYASYRRQDQRSDLDQGAYRDDSNAYIDFRRDLLGYSAGYNISENVTLSFDGAYSWLDRNFVNDSSLVNAAGDYDGEYTETAGEGTLWENELKGTAEGENIRVTAGLSASRQTMNIRSYTFIRDFNFESVTDLDSLNLEENIYNGFLHTKLEGGLLGSGLQSFSLGLGGRYVYHDQFGSRITYEINPGYRISDSAMIYGAVTSGFNAPSLYKLHSPEQGFGAHTNRGNETLKPEESISYELGWKQSLGASATFKLSLYNTKVRNTIEYVYLWEGGTDPDQLSAVDYRGDTYINISRQDIKGIEASVDLQLLSNLSLSGHLSLNESTLTFDPEEIDRSYTGGHHVQIFESGKFVTEEKELKGLTRRPQTGAFVQVQYRPADRLSLNASSRFVGSRDDIYYSGFLGPFGALDHSRIDGYNLTDLNARYRISEALSVSGKIENILDADYTDINGYSTRGRGFFVKARITL